MDWYSGQKFDTTQKRSTQKKVLLFITIQSVYHMIYSAKKRRGAGDLLGEKRENMENFFIYSSRHTFAPQKGVNTHMEGKGKKFVW